MDVVKRDIVALRCGQDTLKETVGAVSDGLQDLRQRGPGRPPRPLPERVPASPEKLARVLVTTPSKKDWDDRRNGGRS